MRLVAQLLAFSRKRVREPGPTDLNEVVSNIASLLRRVIGDDIELRLELYEDLGHVEVDASQAEQAIVNLAVNARDAMPLGGRLTIRTANAVLGERHRTETGVLEAGRYVELSVEDTGSGIDAATRAHLFEPFFTTKEIGKGTGLGLSTVYGFVYGASGQISVRSAPEHGATFTLHLPQVEAAPPLEPAAPPSPASRGCETIVLIEDDDALLRLLGTILESNGYTVLYAVDGAEAIEMLDRHAGAVDLVLTDVVMPRLTGYEVAERLRSRYPQVQFIFMSGYVERRPDIDGGDTAAMFLEKPFTTDDLLTAIRQLLDRSAAA
jgi:CheY-like chemotaxis protein